MPKLIKSVIDSSSPKDKDYIVWDTEIKGFGCRIFPGGKKTYVFHYRAPVTRKYSYIKIGVHGNLTVDEARTKAKGLAFSVSSGVDVKAEKKQEIICEQKSMLFEDFWQIFTEKYIKEKHKSSTQKGNLSRIKNNILPFFRQKPIATIDRRDILSLQDSMSQTKHNFTKCLRLLSVAFHQAEIWEYRDKNSNPCRDVKGVPSRQMERFLSYEELLRLEGILAEQSCNGRSSSTYTVFAIRLLIYTGCRISEILTLKWDDINLKDSFIYLKDSKTGKRTIVLNESAKELIRSIPKKEDNPYVFCGKKPGEHLIDFTKTWQRIRKKANIPDVRIHDLRHSFASFALKKGVDLYTVSKLLGHKNIATTTRYAHLDIDHLKEATNKVAEVFG